MASITINGVFFTYPDDPCLIFNPCIIRVGYNVARVQIYINGYRVTYAASSGECVVDISEYLQSSFTSLRLGSNIVNGKSELGKTVNITVIALASDNTALAQLNRAIFCVWGGTASGEAYDSPHKLIMHQSYPFTLGYYFGAAMDLDIYFEGVDGTQSLLGTYSIESQGVWNIPIYPLATGMVYVSQHGNPSLVYARVKVLEHRDGIYLRWVDRFGFWRYWLFKTGDPTRTAASLYGIWNRIDWEDYDNGTWKNDAGRRQSFTRNDVQPICAPLVSQDVFDVLQDLTTSPAIEMMMEADPTEKWQPVTVEAGQYTKDIKKPEQDFICNLVLPEIPVQSL